MVLCQHCGRENGDPGDPLAAWHCGVCGQGPLVRVPDAPRPPPSPPKQGDSAVAGGTIGGTVGGVFGGPGGILLGAAVGALLGVIIAETTKKQRRARR